MKRILYILPLLVLVIANPGCKKFLNVEPVTSLSGNNYWKTSKDAEDFTKDVYRMFRVSTMSSIVLAMGDFRNGPAKAGATFPKRHDFDYMSVNNLKKTLAADASRTRPGYNAELEWYQARARYDLIPDWTPWYKTIQASNILYKEVDRIEDPAFSEANKKQYKAEAVFMRCLSYFFLVRLYGDVPYYTNAYNQDPLPRTNMITVFRNCIADLEKVKNDLPWTYKDPANRAVRAMRGSAIALMMHMNMWCAGFDLTRSAEYYRAVDTLGIEIETIGEAEQGAYTLLPIEQTYLVMFGRSKEGLFEIQLSNNYGEVSSERRYKFSNSVAHLPFLTSTDRTLSELAFRSAYMKKIFPETVADKRKTEWFDIADIYDETGKAIIYKFFNRSAPTQGDDDNPIIFRYADVILLHAEALAELGDDITAKTLLNRIRARAGAEEFPANPGEGKLKDAIYYERCKELLGEGQYYYDLVRTRKILSADYCYSPMSYSAFIANAWTWPIATKALNNNPYMTLNNYWQ
ncbi:RagB/SusD family nutrient uptake outer membrane protein [Pedobacter frigoris]|uniref:RagB/SusD family nutrient uptake outer membrane protein n=1 Tax=Pedobacter frigoris TaxID=2571272 RepID=A0A4U1CIM5_9SPHI|nr:RagB/SusD family nutrient uptake outer membrane protein [Pedobacter frigoris]TKC05145.1 RagB/SusD family nutrient uptake outer membrane protein [Pedobacter frigoris]